MAESGTSGISRAHVATHTSMLTRELGIDSDLTKPASVTLPVHVSQIVHVCARSIATYTIVLICRSCDFSAQRHLVMVSEEGCCSL